MQNIVHIHDETVVTHKAGAPDASVGKTRPSHISPSGLPQGQTITTGFYNWIGYNWIL